MSKIIRAGFVSDANTYLNGIIAVDVDSIGDAVKVTAEFVDGLKKGWHIDQIDLKDNGDVEIKVKKVQ